MKGPKSDRMFWLGGAGLAALIVAIVSPPVGVAVGVAAAVVAAAEAMTRKP